MNACSCRRYDSMSLIGRDATPLSIAAPRDRDRHVHGQPWIERFRHEVSGSEREELARIGRAGRSRAARCGRARLGRARMPLSWQGLPSSRRTSSAPRNRNGKQSTLLTWLGIVRPPGRDRHIGPRRVRVGRADLGVGVRQRQHQRIAGHRPHHVGIDQPRGRNPPERHRRRSSLRRRLEDRCFAALPRLVGLHRLVAAFVNDSPGCPRR